MSIRKTTIGGGKVRYRVYAYDSSAKKHIYVGSFQRRQDADEAEHEARRRLRLGESVKPKPAREEITFSALSRRWFAGLATVRPATRVDYDQALRRLRPFIGARMVSSITRRDIDEIISSLSVSYSASTVRKTIVILKMVFRTGVDWDYLDRLPTGGSKLSLPKVKKRRFSPLTPSQVRRLVEAAPEYWRPFYLFLLTSGLRRSEAWGLRVKDLDLDRGVVHVRHQLVKRQLVDLKTEAADRRVTLPAQTVAVLREHLHHRPENELDLVFPTVEGRPVEGSNFYSRVWIPTRKAAGLPELRMHDCRHHVASVLLAQGRSVKFVQTTLGHATASVLLDVYAWVTKGEEETAAAEMERWLGEEERSAYRCVRHTSVTIRGAVAA